MSVVLLIGKRARVLDELAEIITGLGHMVKRSEDLDGLERMDIAEVDVVAFGRALTDTQITELETTYRQKNPRMIFVRGLVPIPPLLAIQISAALNARQPVSAKPPTFDRQNHTVTVVLDRQLPVRVTVWWLSIFYREKSKVVIDELLQPGTHTIVMPVWAARSKYYCSVEIGKQQTYII
jgi:hypothetical protein